MRHSPSPSLTSALRLEHRYRQWARGGGVVYRVPPHLWRRTDDKVDDAEIERTIDPRAEKKKYVGRWSTLRSDGARMEKVKVDGKRNDLMGMVPTLKHGLERVLEEDGVHRMVGKGKRSRKGLRGDVEMDGGGDVGGKWVGSIPKVENVAWDRFPKYVPAGRDESLRRMGERFSKIGVGFVGSTSSMTSILAAMYHLVSNFKDTGLLGGLGEGVSQLPKTFVKSYARPTAVTLTRYNGSSVMTVDAHSGLDKSPSILRDLGHPLERMLTMTPDEFLRSCILEDKQSEAVEKPPNYIGSQGKADVKQFYNYSRAGKFLMRAQIDCRDADGNHVFDLKSRAVAAIRYDLDNFKDNAHVKISRISGANGSYEREFYDMVRGAFLKYSLQLRIGRMSGAFFTYHNTTQVLGFEYVSLKEIESYVFGSPRWANVAVGLSFELLGVIFDKAAKSFAQAGSDDQKHRVKILVDSERSSKEMRIYAQRLPSSEDPLHPNVYETAMPEEMARKPKKNRMRSRSPRRHGHGSKDPRRADIASNAEEEYINWLAIENATGAGAGVAAVGLPRAQESDFNFDASKALKKTEEMKSLCHKTGLPLKWVSEPLVAQEDLRVWKLRLVHSVNGRETKSPIVVSEDDDLSLQYSMEEIPVHKKERIRYMTTLKRLYASA